MNFSADTDAFLVRLLGFEPSPPAFQTGASTRLAEVAKSGAVGGVRTHGLHRTRMALFQN